MINDTLWVSFKDDMVDHATLNQQMINDHINEFIYMCQECNLEIPNFSVKKYYSQDVISDLKTEIKNLTNKQYGVPFEEINKLFDEVLKD